MKLTADEVRVASRMRERGASVRRPSGGDGNAVRYRRVWGRETGQMDAAARRPWRGMRRLEAIQEPGFMGRVGRARFV